MHSEDKGDAGKVVDLASEKTRKLYAYNKRRYGDKIRAWRIERGLNTPQLAEKVGITKNAVTNWESGRTRPDINMLPELCDIFGITIGEFFGMAHSVRELSPSEQRHIESYRVLNEYDRKVVDRLVDSLVEARDEESRDRLAREFTTLRHEDAAVSAGTGEDLDHAEAGDWVYVRVNSEVSRADSIITIDGDSMEPTYKNGDEALVQYAKQIDFGEIGVFVVNGEGFIKEYRKDGLHSHNPAYPVIRLYDGDDVRCVGRVVGVLREGQYPTKQERSILDELHPRGPRAR